MRENPPLASFLGFKNIRICTVFNVHSEYCTAQLEKYYPTLIQYWHFYIFLLQPVSTYTHILYIVQLLENHQISVQIWYFNKNGKCVLAPVFVFAKLFIELVSQQKNMLPPTSFRNIQIISHVAWGVFKICNNSISFTTKILFPKEFRK